MRTTAESSNVRTKIEEILKKLEAHEDNVDEDPRNIVQDTDNGMSEIHSPPRVAARTKCHNLKFGFSFDLTCIDNQRTPWDFSIANMKKTTIDKLNGEQPEMLIVSPKCRLFNQFQNQNYQKLNLEEMETNSEKKD